VGKLITKYIIVTAVATAIWLGTIAGLVSLFAAEAYASDTVRVAQHQRLPVTTRYFGKIDSARVMVLEGPVAGYTIDPLIDQLNELAEKPKKPAYLEINSPGGSIPAGLKFIPRMRDLKAHRGLKVTCVIRAKAYSMAAYIASFCHETYMLPVSDLMFHGASFRVGGPADIVEARTRHLMRWIRESEEFLAKQLGLTYTQYLSIRGVELWLLGPEAASRGFVNGITPYFYHEAKSAAQPPLRRLFSKDGFIIRREDVKND